MRSKMGKRAESLEANSRMSSCSYASAISSSESSASETGSAEARSIRVGSMVWMFSSGMGTLDQRVAVHSAWLESSWSRGTMRSSA